ncbi:MAG: histidine phosphatase family protein [Chloroflexi bacterium]|nr:histidine phosphatase family protein [Chloroflexota bacterium]
MNKILLTRHAEPAWNENATPSQWELTDAGRQRAAELGDYLAERNIAAVYASTEIKAIQTAEIAGGASGKKPVIVHDLREHERENTVIVGSAVRRAFVIDCIRNQDGIIYGSEPVSVARKRFCSAIADLMQQHTGATVAVVAHGTVISTFVAEMIDVDPVPIWESIGLPGFIEIDWPNPTSIICQLNFD